MGAGSFVHLPKDIPHTYENVGAGPARFLTLLVPAGLEKFFEEVGKPGSDVSSQPPFEEEDIEKTLGGGSEVRRGDTTAPRTVVWSAGVQQPRLFLCPPSFSEKS